MQTDDLRKLLDEMTPGPWEWYDGCSWRRLATVASSGCETVVCPTKNQYDGHPDTIVKDGDARAIALLPTILQRLIDAEEALAKSVPMADVLRLLDESVERWEPLGGEPAYIDGYTTGIADACSWLAEDVRDLPAYFAACEAHRKTLANQEPTNGK